MNNKKVSIPNYNKWAVAGKVNVKLKSGDVIKFVGENRPTVKIFFFKQNNPAGLLGEIQYVDKRGRKRTIVTDKSWKCDGKRAIEYGRNGANNVWTRNNRGPIKGITTKAKWIWSSQSKRRVTCTIRLP